MMTKQLLTLTSLFVFVFNVFGQVSNTYLKVGDKMPDLKLGTVINGKMKERRISDFQGKLLILDFWTTTCASCIAGFPEMAALQETFPDKIRILPIALELEKSLKNPVWRVDRKLSVLKGGKFELKLPTVVSKIGDNRFRKLFYMETVPQHIWINENGIIIAITNGISTSALNIAQYLDGKMPYLSNTVLTVDGRKYWYLGEDKEFLIKEQKNINEKIKTPVFGAAISRGDIDTVRGSVEIIDTSKGIIRIAAVRRTLPSILIDILYGQNNSTNEQFVILRDSLYKFGKTGEDLYIKDIQSLQKWRNLNFFNYEMIIPLQGNSIANAKEYLLSDLKRNLNIDVYLKDTTMKCIVLKKLDKGLLMVKDIRDHVGPVINDFNTSSTFPYHIISRYYQLIGRKGSLPILDETNLNKMERFYFPLVELEQYFNDHSSAKWLLNQFGLDIVEELKPVKVIIVTPKKQKL